MTCDVESSGDADGYIITYYEMAAVCLYWVTLYRHYFYYFHYTLGEELRGDDGVCQR